MITQAVILCGGNGTRLLPHTKDIPKPLVEVNGRPFLTYMLRDLISVGIQDIVLLPKDFGDQFKVIQDYFPGFCFRIGNSASTIKEEVLGISNLKDRFFIVNGDCYPVGDLKGFLDSDNVYKMSMQSKIKDAGCAIVSRGIIELDWFDCSNFSKGIKGCPNFISFDGCISINTPKDLEFAEEYFRGLNGSS